MKKHPVDDLFNKKLTNLERIPSADAWSRIESRHKNEKGKTIAWIWYVAAGVTITLMTGYLVWKNQPDPSSGLIQKTEVAVNQNHSGRMDSTHETGKGEPIIAKAGPGLQNLKNKKETEKYVSSEKDNALSKNDLNGLKQYTQKIIAEENEDVTENNKQEASQESVETAVAINNNMAEPTAPVQIEKPEENRVIIVKVEEPEDTEKKVSRFTKVFRQLKNARAGERVDWDEVGFNPKTIVARVDDRLNGDDQKQNNKKQRKN